MDDLLDVLYAIELGSNLTTGRRQSQGFEINIMYQILNHWHSHPTSMRLMIAERVRDYLLAHPVITPPMLLGLLIQLNDLSQIQILQLLTAQRSETGDTAVDCVFDVMNWLEQSQT